MVSGDPPIDRVAVIWRCRWWILAAALMISSLAVGASLLVPATYKASALVRVTVLPPAGGGPQDAVLAANDLAMQYAQLVDSSPVRAAAAQALGGSPGPVKGGTVAEQNLISVESQGGTAAAAARRADAAARAFVAYLTAESVRQTAAAAAPLRTQLETAQAAVEATVETIATIGADVSKSAAARSAAVQARTAVLQGQVSSVQRLQTQIGQLSVTPTVELLAAAGGGQKIAPKPALYGAVAFIVTLVLCGQGAVLISGWRRRV